jgi:hypothetical protein
MPCKVLTATPGAATYAAVVEAAAIYVDVTASCMTVVSHSVDLHVSSLGLEYDPASLLYLDLQRLTPYTAALPITLGSTTLQYSQYCSKTCYCVLVMPKQDLGPKSLVVSP